MYQLNAVESHTPEADPLKKIIKDAFREHFDASILEFMPILAQITDGDHQLVATFGLRPAQNSILLSEFYLTERSLSEHYSSEPEPLKQHQSTPIERIISKHENQIVNRSDILEVGQLIMQDPKATKELFRIMTEYCQAHQYAFMVFTVIRTLKLHMDRHKIPTTVLAGANSQAMANAQQWGSYYRHKPVVLYVNVRNAYDILHAKVLIHDSR